MSINTSAVELADSSKRDWAPVAVRLAENYSSRPDFEVFVDATVPSL